MNREAYNKIATQWSAVRSVMSARERACLAALLGGAPVETTVLDLGCGTGRPMAEYIVSQGRRVVGVDQSECMLDIARKNLPDQSWILSSIEAYEPTFAYQAVLLWDSLFHIQRTKHEPILSKAVRGLPRGGRLMLTVGGSAHPAFTDFMFGQEFYYDSNTPEETAAILNRLGCREIIAEYLNIPDGGRDKGRYAFVVQKA